MSLAAVENGIPSSNNVSASACLEQISVCFMRSTLMFVFCDTIEVSRSNPSKELFSPNLNSHFVEKVM